MLKNFSLKSLNTWQVGGNCSLFAAPSSVDEARGIVKINQFSNNIYILGGGSNILVSDGSIDATVIHTVNLSSIAASDDDKNVKITVGCGCQTKTLLAFAIKNKLGGLEFLTGIPGTLGGALWGNAGAREADGFPIVVQYIDTIEEDGSYRRYKRDEIHWKYRTCPLKTDNTAMIAGCELLLQKAELRDIFSNIRKFSDLKKGQPLGKRTAGCVFKNPRGFSAGKLLDESGCGAMRVGGAVVSSSHANFIENDDNASAQDIFDLSEKCRNKVFSEYGVKLEYEIHFLGTFKKS